MMQEHLGGKEGVLVLLTEEELMWQLSTVEFTY